MAVLCEFDGCDAIPDIGSLCSVQRLNMSQQALIFRSELYKGFLAWRAGEQFKKLFEGEDGRKLKITEIPEAKMERMLQLFLAVAPVPGAELDEDAQAKRKMIQFCQAFRHQVQDLYAMLARLLDNNAEHFRMWEKAAARS